MARHISRGGHIGNNAAVIRTAAAIGDDAVVYALVDGVEEQRGFSCFVSTEGKRYKILSFNVELVAADFAQ